MNREELIEQAREFVTKRNNEIPATSAKHRLDDAVYGFMADFVEQVASQRVRDERKAVAAELTQIRNEARYDAQEWKVNVEGLISRLEDGKE